MGYISKHDTKFTTFMNRKYSKYGVFFYSYDDYILWLYEFCKNDEDKYYEQLEKDLGQYSNWQNGIKRGVGCNEEEVLDGTEAEDRE